MLLAKNLDWNTFPHLRMIKKSEDNFCLKDVSQGAEGLIEPWTRIKVIILESIGNEYKKIPGKSEYFLDYDLVLMSMDYNGRKSP